MGEESNMNKELSLKGFYLRISTAKKGTCWWGKSGNDRYDHLLSFDRVYLRSWRVYVYRFTLGRLLIAFGKIK